MTPAIAPTAIPAFAPVERPGAGDEDGVVELPDDRELAREDSPTEDTEAPVAEAVMLGALEILDGQLADFGKFVTSNDPHS